MLSRKSALDKMRRADARHRLPSALYFLFIQFFGRSRTIWFYWLLWIEWIFDFASIDFFEPFSSSVGHACPVLSCHWFLHIGCCVTVIGNTADVFFILLSGMFVTEVTCSNTKKGTILFADCVKLQILNKEFFRGRLARLDMIVRFS